MWAQLLPNLIPGILQRDQYGLETYWNIGVTPDITFTPGIQFVFNPVLNHGVRFVAIPSVKFRVAL